MAKAERILRNSFTYWVPAVGSVAARVFTPDFQTPLPVSGHALEIGAAVVLGVAGLAVAKWNGIEFAKKRQAYWSSPEGQRRKWLGEVAHSTQPSQDHRYDRKGRRIYPSTHWMMAKEIGVFLNIQTYAFPETNKRPLLKDFS